MLEYFLKHQDCQFGYVLPRSFLSADQHENTRSGKAKGFYLTEIWDLKDVQPLFNVPSCVLIGKKKTLHRPTPFALEGLAYKGRLPKHNLDWEHASPKITKTPQQFHYATLGKRSAFSTTASDSGKNLNYYNPLFKQGATIVPRNFFFIEILNNPPDLENRIVHILSDPENKKDGKAPWKELSLEGSVHARFLFRTALAKNVLPFVLIHPPIIVLPAEVNSENGKINLLTPDQILHLGEYETAKWFAQAEKLWKNHKTDSSERMNLLDRINFQKGITDQQINLDYWVIYTGSAKDANSCIIRTKELDKPFIAESKEYYFCTNNLSEAHYLLMFLNSNYANLMIKPFQSRGLFGPRDIHKKILEVPLAQYDSCNEKHQKLAALGAECERKAQAFITAHGAKDLSGPKLGNLRLQIRELLKEELLEADGLLQG